MTDLSSAIVPKSDQLNADDLLTGPRTIKVTKVTKRAGEQPISVHYEGDEGKPWKPCKSMCRVLVSLWGANGDEFAGRSLTLFTDPGVKWAGMEVGGIRISHMSHIETDTVLPLTVTKGKREPYRVKVLKVDSSPPKPRGDIAKALATIEAWEGPTEALKAGMEKQLAEFAWSGKERAQIKAALEGKATT
jgi:hypothetical protein